jgi:hypothetical protein
MPAVAPGKVRQHLVPVRTEEESSLDRLQQFQQCVKVLLRIAIVMSLIRSDVGWVAIEEGALRTVAPNEPQRVAALDPGTPEPFGVLHREVFFRLFADFLP